MTKRTFDGGNKTKDRETESERKVGPGCECAKSSAPYCTVQQQSASRLSLQESLLCCISVPLGGLLPLQRASVTITVLHKVTHLFLSHHHTHAYARPLPFIALDLPTQRVSCRFLPAPCASTTDSALTRLPPLLSGCPPTDCSLPRGIQDRTSETSISSSNSDIEAPATVAFCPPVSVVRFDVSVY